MGEELRQGKKRQLEQLVNLRELNCIPHYINGTMKFQYIYIYMSNTTNTNYFTIFLQTADVTLAFFK